jgi:dihydrofolate reductase
VRHANIEAAVRTALDAAQGRNLVVFGPTLATQCLDAGLLDEIIVGVAPVLLGDGIRFFGGPGAGQRRLEPVSVSPMGYFANLHYRVFK